jgi:hypothetical protein
MATVYVIGLVEYRSKASDCIAANQIESAGPKVAAQKHITAFFHFLKAL